MKNLALLLITFALCGNVVLAQSGASDQPVPTAGMNEVSSSQTASINQPAAASDSLRVERTSTRVLSLAVVLAILLVAITRWNIHPFLALLMCSLLLGPVSGLLPTATVEAFLSGFANIMKGIGVVIVLGALIGELLNHSGGTMTIARTILSAVGAKRLPVAMGVTGYIVSIPAFVDIAYIMLKPIVEVLAVKSQRNVLVVGLSLAAGLTASHALLPPTPGPLATADLLGADLGRVIMINAVVAAFAVSGGLLWATLYCGRVKLRYDDVLSKELEQTERAVQADTPNESSFLFTLAPILLPLALIAAGAFLIPTQVADGSVRQKEVTGLLAVLQFLSIPVVALLCGAMAGMFLLRRGTRLVKLGGLVEKAIEHSAVVLLITAAGGGFGAVIKATGVGDDIATLFVQMNLPMILFPFLIAATLTTATGSLTVSMVTSAGIVASMLPSLGMSAEFAVAMIGAGSLCIIHANSSFFWLLSRLHDVPPAMLYRTYSVQSVCMSLGGLLGLATLYLLGVR